MTKKFRLYSVIHDPSVGERARRGVRIEWFADLPDGSYSASEAANGDGDWDYRYCYEFFDDESQRLLETHVRSKFDADVKRFDPVAAEDVGEACGRLARCGRRPHVDRVRAGAPSVHPYLGDPDLFDGLEEGERPRYRGAVIG